MTKLTYIKAAGDLKIPVESWVTHVPGIIVTAVPPTEPPEHTGYRLTHEATGLALFLTPTFPSIDIAILFADIIKVNRLDRFVEPLDKKELRSGLQPFLTSFMEDLENNPQLILKRTLELKNQQEERGDSAAD